MGFFRQEYWSGYPFPSPGHLPNPGIKSRSPTLQADSFPAEPPGKPIHMCCQLNTDDEEAKEGDKKKGMKPEYTPQVL